MKKIISRLFFSTQKYFHHVFWPKHFVVTFSVLTYKNYEWYGDWIELKKTNCKESMPVKC